MNKPTKTIAAAAPVKKVVRLYGEVENIRLFLRAISTPRAEAEEPEAEEPPKKEAPSSQDYLDKVIDVFMYRNHAAFKTYELDLDLLRAKWAIKEKKTSAIIMNPDGQNYQFMISGKIAFNKELLTIFDKKEIEFIPVICTDESRIKNLSESCKMLLNGLIFNTEIIDI